MYPEPPTRIYCPPREKHPPVFVDNTAPVKIYQPPHPS